MQQQAQRADSSLLAQNPTLNTSLSTGFFLFKLIFGARTNLKYVLDINRTLEGKGRTTCTAPTASQGRANQNVISNQISLGEQKAERLLFPDPVYVFRRFMTHIN